MNEYVDYFYPLLKVGTELDPFEGCVVVCFTAAQSCHGQQCWSWVLGLNIREGKEIDIQSCQQRAVGRRRGSKLPTLNKST